MDDWQCRLLVSGTANMSGQLLYLKTAWKMEPFRVTHVELLERCLVVVSSARCLAEVIASCVWSWQNNSILRLEIFGDPEL